MGDLTEREFWDEYQEAYQIALKETHHKTRPWFIIPSDNKDFRDYEISKILVAHLKKLKPQFPILDPKLLRKLKAEADRALKKKR